MPDSDGNPDWKDIFGSEQTAVVTSNYTVHAIPDRKSPPSVYFTNYRSVFPDNYPAKFNEQLAKDLIELYTDLGDVVLDPMAGSGTIPLMAISLKRKGYYQDINEEARALFMDKLHNLGDWDDHCWRYRAVIGDSTQEIDCEDNVVELILTSPPFGLTIDAAHDKYSDLMGDLANSGSYPAWRTKMKAILKECFRVLKPNGLCIVETRPRSKKGHSFPLDSWITEDGISISFEYFSKMVEYVPPYRNWSFGDKKRRKPMPYHSDLTMLIKPIKEGELAFV